MPSELHAGAGRGGAQLICRVRPCASSGVTQMVTRACGTRKRDSPRNGVTGRHAELWGLAGRTSYDRDHRAQVIVDRSGSAARELVERARAEGVELVGPGGLLSGLTKTVLETALEAEINDAETIIKGQAVDQGSASVERKIGSRTRAIADASDRVATPRTTPSLARLASASTSRSPPSSPSPCWPPTPRSFRRSA
jgi:hypothetical protein